MGSRFMAEPRPSRESDRSSSTSLGQSWFQVKESGGSTALDRRCHLVFIGKAAIGNRVVEVDLMGRRFRHMAMAKKVFLDHRHADFAARHLRGKPSASPSRSERLKPQPW